LPTLNASLQIDKCTPGDICTPGWEPFSRGLITIVGYSHNKNKPIFSARPRACRLVQIPWCNIWQETNVGTTYSMFLQKV